MTSTAAVLVHTPKQSFPLRHVFNPVPRTAPDTMRIAVGYDEGEVFQHFGRTEYFKIYEVEGGKVVSSRIVGNGGLAHGGLVQILLDNDVDTFICGGIGAGARQMIQSRGIDILPGARGSCDACVDAFLKGSLQYDPDTECHHHDGGEHDCNCHRFVEAFLDACPG